MTAVTVEQTTTATKMAKPSTHACPLSAASAVPTSIPMLANAATIRIFSVKSSSASIMC